MTRRLSSLVLLAAARCSRRRARRSPSRRRRSTAQKITEAEVEAELDTLRDDPVFGEALKRDPDTRGQRRREILRSSSTRPSPSRRRARLGVERHAGPGRQPHRADGARARHHVDKLLENENLSRSEARRLALRGVRRFALIDKVVEAGRRPRRRRPPRSTKASATGSSRCTSSASPSRRRRRGTRDPRGASNDGEDFSSRRARTARSTISRTKGGDMGFVPLTSLDVQVQDAVAQAVEGGLTDPIQGADGVRDLPRRRTQDEVVRRGRGRDPPGAHAGRRDQRYQVWLAERVRKARVDREPEVRPLRQASSSSRRSSRRPPSCRSSRAGVANRTDLGLDPRIARRVRRAVRRSVPPARRGHGEAARTGRVPVGPGADARDPRAPPARGDLRDARGDRGRRPRRAARRARRSRPPGRLPLGDRVRGGRVQRRRRPGRPPSEAHQAPPARLRRRPGVRTRTRSTRTGSGSSATRRARPSSKAIPKALPALARAAKIYRRARRRRVRVRRRVEDVLDRPEDELAELRAELGRRRRGPRTARGRARRRPLHASACARAASRHRAGDALCATMLDRFSAVRRRWKRWPRDDGRELESLSRRRVAAILGAGEEHDEHP